ncbi:caspase, EACC1-associated type [Couchioplanes azureus]|uniref:caspase, EACC1-associated type n=1 Tax=Couchioplanes caeruleus TaxID=56438 RepID=UPI0016717690|nr:caspase family protein [Couchioplanes caeruleus]GGQ81736.1 hypothetical protein GCM10010166_59830 [Couchioplanes caeruleus subsp. azureus]
MSGSPPRRALLLGCTTFADPTLASLRSPRRDVEDLEQVLRHSRSCGYDVSTELDCTSRTAQRAIEGFLARARTTDGINILYLSCHGIQDDRGRLHFAFADTEKEYLSSTSVSADWVRDRVDASRSKSTLMLIDCCFSGAFIDGMQARSGAAVNVESLVTGIPQGRRLAVLTASGDSEVSLEDAASAEVRPSYFTEAIIAGLSSGAADLNGDGRITVDELYEYVYDRILTGPSPQRPRRLGLGEGALVVADGLPAREQASSGPAPEPSTAEPAARPAPAPPVREPHPASAPARQPAVLRVQGVLGYASFDGQWVVIGKDGVGQAHKGERRFHVGRLIGVASRPATRLTHGFLQVLVEGVEPAPVARFGAHAGRPPMEDFASISFAHKANADVERLCAAVQAAIDVGRGVRPAAEAEAGMAVHSAVSGDRPAGPASPTGTPGGTQTAGRQAEVAAEPRAQAQAGERAGAEAMLRLPMVAVDGVVSCDFDVVRWLAPWREQWAAGREPPPWLPGLTRCLGEYAAPPGHPDAHFQPSPEYLGGFREGLRRTWHGAAHSGLMPADRETLLRWLAQPPQDPRLPPVPATTTIADLQAARGRANRRAVFRWIGRPLMWLSIVLLAAIEVVALVDTLRGGGLRDENGEPYANQTAAAIGLNACFVVPLALLVTLALVDLHRMRRGRR